MIPLPDLSHLLKYPDATVQYDDRMKGWETKRAQLTPKKLCWLWDNPSAYRNLKLVLRPIWDISEAEAKECFRLAFTVDEQERLFKYYSPSEGLNLQTNTYHLLITEDGYLRAKTNDGLMLAVQVHATAVVDYLRSLGYDLDGYLASGLAVEKEN